MKLISTTEARKRLGELVDIVKYQRTAIAIGKHGRAEALLIAIPGQDDTLPITAINAASESFRFLENEPELYDRADIPSRS